MVGPQETLSFEDALDAIGNIRRRKLLIDLLENNPAPNLPSIAGADEGGVAMEHVHLPKLVDYGLIEWDRENHDISKGSNFVEIRPMVELLNNNSEELPEVWL